MGIIKILPPAHKWGYITESQKQAFMQMHKDQSQDKRGTANIISVIGYRPSKTQNKQRNQRNRKKAKPPMYVGGGDGDLEQCTVNRVMRKALRR